MNDVGVTFKNSQTHPRQSEIRANFRITRKNFKQFTMIFSKFFCHDATGVEISHILEEENDSTNEHFAGANAYYLTAWQFCSLMGGNKSICHRQVEIL